MYKKFYATFKGIGCSEIAMFNTKRERDAWVNFQDPFSSLDKSHKEYGIPRKALSTKYAVQRIRAALHKALVNDACNQNQKWYLLGGSGA